MYNSTTAMDDQLTHGVDLGEYISEGKYAEINSLAI